MTDRRVVFEPFARQQEFLDAFLDGKFTELVYGGAIRGGKSFLGIALIILLCKAFPGSRWAIVRANLPRIKMNVMPVFGKLRPEGFIGEVNKTNWSATCANGSEILFIAESIKDDPELNKMRGFEVNGMLFEEGNEMSVRTMNAARERVGTWNVPGLKDQPPAFTMITCNPGQSWVKEQFHDPHVAKRLPPHRYFLQATAHDNPYIDDEQKARWKGMPEHLYRRYVLGDWTVSDEPDQVIPYVDLHNVLVQPEDIADELAALVDAEEALGVDYGGQGEDSTAFAHMRGNLLYEISTFERLTQGRVSSMILAAASERGILPSRVGVDAIGEGSGVWGNLSDAGFAAHRVMAGGAPYDIARTDAEKAIQLQYQNLKSQMWWTMRRDVMAGDVRIVNDSALVQDLLAHRYKITNGRSIVIEAKDGVKARIGRSPDRGDAAVMANLIRQVRPPEIAAYEEETLKGDELVHFQSIWS